MSQGLISLFIPLIAILLAMITKRIIAVLGILNGGILLAGGSIINGWIYSV